MEHRILLVGGGSGGHVYPLAAIARSLKEKAVSSGIDIKLLLMGGSFIKKVADENGLTYKIISAGKLRRYGSIQNFFDIARFFIGFLQSAWHIFWFMPDVVFTKGGAVSIAPALIAKLFFIPVYIHESDSIPGIANRLIGKIANRVFISFKSAEKVFEDSKIIFTGNPVRRSLMTGDRNEAKNYFELPDERPTILILGGSQGARIINEIVLSSLVALTEKYNVIHQCGENQFESVKKGVDTILKESSQQYAEPVQRYYRYFAFLNESSLSLAYALCYIVVSRAGAGALFEIAQIGKPSIIVPIAQSSNNHQYFNAFEFNLSGGYMIEESGFNSVSLMHAIEFLLGPEKYKQTSERIRTFATPDAADIIAMELLK